jgi:hypothetical protein
MAVESNRVALDSALDVLLHRISDPVARTLIEGLGVERRAAERRETCVKSGGLSLLHGVTAVECAPHGER